MLTSKQRVTVLVRAVADIFFWDLSASFVVLVEWVTQQQRQGTMATVRIVVISSGHMTSRDNLWLKLMAIGCHSGCHQMPERSFSINGYQFPVCARCTGVLIGYISALISCFLVRPNVFIAIPCCLVMLTDWLLQYLKIKASTNPRRLVTGIIGGFGVMSFYCMAILWVVDFTKN